MSLSVTRLLTLSILKILEQPILLIIQMQLKTLLDLQEVETTTSLVQIQLILIMMVIQIYLQDLQLAVFIISKILVPQVPLRLQLQFLTHLTSQLKALTSLHFLLILIQMVILIFLLVEIMDQYSIQRISGRLIILILTHQYQILSAFLMLLVIQSHH